MYFISVYFEKKLGQKRAHSLALDKESYRLCFHFRH
jgi:hypothetical protein